MTRKPKHINRTNIPAYVFGSAKAGAIAQKKAGTDRKMSKLPTSVEKLKAALDDIVYNGPGTAPDSVGTDAFAAAFDNEEEKP